MANCLDETQVEIMLSNVNGICGCAPCDTEVIDNTIPTMTGLMVIYYGRSASTSLNEAQVMALGGASQLNFAGIFNYVASVGTYIYFAYPSIWGTPTRFKDLIGGFDVVMNSPQTVAILSENYTVYRSFNQLAGAQSIEVIQ